MEADFLLESLRGEWAQAMIFEDDSDVLAYYPQPVKVDLVLRNSAGKVTGRRPCTPDFLVIRNDRIEFVEVRDESRLLAAALQSDSYYKDQEGFWHYRHAEEHFSGHGIPYRIISTVGIPLTLVVNSRFLEDYLRPDCPPLSAETTKKLVSILQVERIVLFAWLISEHAFDADTLFKAIAARDIYVDLNTDRLDVSSDLMVAYDKATSDMHRLAQRADLEPVLPIPGCTHVAAGSIVKFDGKQFVVVLCGESDAVIRDEDGAVRPVPMALLQQLHQKTLIESDSVEKRRSLALTVANCSPQDLQRGISRLEALKRGDLSEISRSTLARYASATALAQNDFEAAMALIGNASVQGNRINRLPLLVEELAEKAIRQRFNQPERPHKKAAYATFVGLCVEEAAKAEIQIVPMSYPTFCKRCDELEDVKRREGKRAAYQKRPIPSFLNQAFPVQGVRPHDICYVDQRWPRSLGQNFLVS